MLEAARYLSTTELFKLEKVVVSEDWVNSVSRTGSGNVNYIVNPNDEPCDIVIDEEEQGSEILDFEFLVLRSSSITLRS